MDTITSNISSNTSVSSSTMAPDDNNPNIAAETSSAWPYIAGLFAMTAIFLSLFEIFKHMQYYNKPYLQKYIVRILWMVPIYALNSWLAMFFPSTSIYMDTLRECYEAFVIYSFMKYLFNFLQYDLDEYETLVDCKPELENTFPFCLFPPLPAGRKFLQVVRHAMIQYIVLRPITTILALIFQTFGVYGEGHFSLRTGYVYLFVINNCSQTIAMYMLIMFYQNYKRELRPMRPLGKFLSIKAVIFFSFFQGVLLTLLIYLGVITQSFIPSSMAHISTNEMSRNLQDFLICFEMFLAAIAHIFVFSHKPFIDDHNQLVPMFYSFSRIVDMSDERSDVIDHFQQIGNRMKNLLWTGNNSGHKSNSYNVDNYRSSFNKQLFQNLDSNPSTSSNSTASPLIPLQLRRNYGSSSTSESQSQQPNNLPQSSSSGFAPVDPKGGGFSKI